MDTAGDSLGSMEWSPPSDPDFVELAEKCRVAWTRDQPSVLAWDTETSGFLYTDAAFCITVAWRGADGIESHYLELDNGPQSDLAKRILSQASDWIGHNIKFDLNKGIDAHLTERGAIPTIHDTEALAHLDDEHRLKGLKPLAVDLLKYDDTIELVYKSGKKKGETYQVAREKWEIEEAKKWVKKKYNFASVNDFGYDLLPRGTLVPYAIKDALWTYQLYELLRPRIEQYADLWSLYKQEMELTLTLLDMERAGMEVDPPYVDEKVREYSKRVLEHNWLIEGIVGKPVRTGKIPKKERAEFFNPSSSSPDAAAFLRADGWDRESYDAANLKTIDHPLATALLKLREDEKILGTYFKSIQAEEVDGIVHPNIRQHGTVTGRVSSGKETG